MEPITIMQDGVEYYAVWDGTDHPGSTPPPRTIIVAPFVHRRINAKPTDLQRVPKAPYSRRGEANPGSDRAVYNKGTAA